MAAEGNHTAAARPIFNVGDLDLDDEDSEEEEDDVEEEKPLILTPNPHPPPPQPQPPPPYDDVFGVDDVEEEEEEEEEEEDVTSSALAGRLVTVAVPSQPPPTAASASDFKRRRFEDHAAAAAAAAVAVEEKKPSAALDDSRRLFQRLWTDEDEIELLQGFLEYTTQRGSSQHHHHDTALFYDQIRGKLQLEFNKNQLVEKLRRLKKKYRNVVNRISSGKDFSFKSPHDQATFEISRKIWSNAAASCRSAAIPEETTNPAFDDDDANTNPYSTPNPYPNPNYHGNDGVGMGGIDVNVPSSEKKGSASRSRKRSRGKSPEKHNSAPPPPLPAAANAASAQLGRSSSIPTLVEETVRSCLSPFFKELLHNAMGGPGIRGYGGMATLNSMPLSFSGPLMLNFSSGEVADERWRKQQILELEVYAKRLELVQDQIKSALEDLRSMGS